MQRADDDGARPGARVAGDGAELVDLLEARRRRRRRRAARCGRGPSRASSSGANCVATCSRSRRRRNANASATLGARASMRRPAADTIATASWIVMRWSASARMRRSRSPVGVRRGEELPGPADLAGHGLGRERVEVVEVAEHRAFGHAGARRDPGGAGLGLALVEELEQRGHDELAAPFGPEPAPVDRLAARRRLDRAGGRCHRATLSNDSQTVKTLATTPRGPRRNRVRHHQQRHHLAVPSAEREVGREQSAG